MSDPFSTKRMQLKNSKTCAFEVDFLRLCSFHPESDENIVFTFLSSSRYTVVISAVDLETPDESVADWSIRRTYAQLQVN